MAPILINDNIISTAAQRGITRYFGKIMDGVIARFGKDAAICSPIAHSYTPARHWRTIRFKGSWRIGLQDKLASAVALIERPAAVYSVYYGHVDTHAAQAYTVYDMMHELSAPPNHPFIPQKRRCLEHAAVLFAISNHTAQDIVRIYPHIDASKIVVTPLGVDDSFFAGGSLQRSVPGKPYFLYVGHRTPYKNFMRLLTAYGQSGLSKQFNLEVISPGAGGYTLEELACIQTYHLEAHVHLQIAPPDSALRERYAGAAAFVCPSLYEGFGLPVLEAMASGTLVAASNTSSLPEVGGDVAFYFEPESAESIADCLQRIASLPTDERARKISAGVARAHTFIWERCQQQTNDALARLAA
jgi:glycosyltransferase involved in cell wall biosynthesis